MRSAICLALVLLALAAGATAVIQKRDRIQSVPSSSIPGAEKLGVEFTERFGYINVDKENGADLFFILAESQNKPATDPLVLWLTGGPGCASELAAYFENGPYFVNEDLSLRANPYSWNNNATVVWVDSPAGTGWSTLQNPLGYANNEATVARDLIRFIQGLYAKFPQYKSLPFHIIGESFAGHYVPALTAAIVDFNAQNPSQKIPITTMSVGNGWTDPEVQAASYAPFLYAHNLIDSSCLNEANRLYSSCKNYIDQGQYGIAFQACNQVLGQVLQCAGNINYYDIRKQCNPPPLCYSGIITVGKYLNQASVRQHYGVGSLPWQACNGDVYQHLELDFEKNYRFDIPKVMAAGVKSYIYNGEYDLVCNFYGTAGYLESMQWSGQSGFNNAQNKTWTVDGQVAGSSRTYSNLTFVRVANAGHMVPHDQPKNALDMLLKITLGSGF